MIMFLCNIRHCYKPKTDQLMDMQLKKTNHLRGKGQQWISCQAELSGKV